MAECWINTQWNNKGYRGKTWSKYCLVWNTHYLIVKTQKSNHNLWHKCQPWWCQLLSSNLYSNWRWVNFISIQHLCWVANLYLILGMIQFMHTWMVKGNHKHVYVNHIIKRGTTLFQNKSCTLSLICLMGDDVLTILLTTPRPLVLCILYFTGQFLNREMFSRKEKKQCIICPHSVIWTKNLQTCTGIEGVATSTRFPPSSNRARTCSK